MLSHDSPSSVEVHGRSVAAMVCADVLARAGLPVRLIAEGILGGSFRPIEVDGFKLELGPRLFELDYGDGASQVTDPRGYIYGGHRVHMGLIRSYVEGLVTPRRVHMRVERDGFNGPDFLMTSNLHSLPEHCSRSELSRIEFDAQHAAVEFGRLGLPVSELRQRTYRWASMMLHGRAFHELFIMPMLDRILGPMEDLPALDHRRVWLPLFRPGEVLDAARGECTRPVREMFVGMGAAVEALAARVEPLREAALPAGRVSSVVDEPRAIGARTVLQSFEWSRARTVEPCMIWLYGSQPFFRETVADGVVCWESGAARSASRRDVIAGVQVAVPLVDTGFVDPRAGRIGVGSFNEQVLQGISAAAWRLPEDWWRPE